MTVSNPFRQVGQVASGDRYIERPELEEPIRAVLREPGRPANLSVLGQHRTGKTSVVKRVLGEHDRADPIVVPLNVGVHTGGRDLFRAMTDTVTERLAAQRPPAAPPELPARAAEVRRAADWYDTTHSVRAFFAALGAAGRSALFVLDEFDRAAEVFTRFAQFQFLRDLVSEDYPIGLLTISRRPVDKIEETSGDGSVLHGVIPDGCDVGMYSDEQIDLLLGRAAAAGLDLTPVRARIVELAGGHPFLLESLCNRIVRWHAATGRLDVAAAFEQEGDTFGRQFRQLVRAIDQDLGARAVALLGRLAAGGTPNGAALDLKRLRRTGIVSGPRDRPALFSAEFGRYVRGSAPRPPAPAAAAHRCSALVLATEWSSAHGGLSTFNRHLCRALAAAGVKVYCAVLAMTDEDFDDARTCDVTLLRADKLPGGSDDGGSDDARLGRRPAGLPAGVVPDIIIGHSRITGRAAYMLREDTFPGARRLHFVHMAPDEIEWYKSGRVSDPGALAEERTATEVALGRHAERLVAVGPRLYNRFRDEQAASNGRAAFRLDPGFDVPDPGPRQAPPGSPMRILLVGRTEDPELKGLDLAAEACGLVAKWHKRFGLLPIELLVRGAPAEASARQRADLMSRAGHPGFGIVVYPYSTDGDSLAKDLRVASVLIMPSRAEGFGLVGLEAIIAGTPVLVSENSGLAELLRETVDRESAGRLIVPMSGNRVKDKQSWALAIMNTLYDRKAAFDRAGELRTLLAGRRPWSLSIEKLLKDLGY